LLLIRIRDPAVFDPGSGIPDRKIGIRGGKFGSGIRIPELQNWIRLGTEIKVSDPDSNPDPKKICKKEPYF
jgi:hypothetical protein